MSKKQIYYFYYSRKNDINYCLKEGTKEIITMTQYEKAESDYKFFEMNKKYDPEPETLFKYEKDFKRCVKEIKEYTNGLFEYDKWMKDRVSVETYFKLKANKYIKKNNIENSTPDEFLLSELCFNGGLLYLDDEYKRKVIECYGYDFSNCYAFMLGNFKVAGFRFPTKAGKWTTLNVDILRVSSFKYGYYTATIESNHPIIKKYFKFSPDRTYTYQDLRQLNILIQYIIKKDKKQTIQTIFQKFAIDEKCYIYDDKILIDSSKIYYPWFKDVNDMKKDLKDNMLVKNLASTLWGSNTQYKRIYVNDDEIDNYEYGMSHNFVQKNKMYEYMCIKINKTKDKVLYELVKMDDAYKMGGLGRIKSFLIAHIRFYITKMILENNLDDNVIRLCTDGICLNKEVDFSKMHLSYYPVPEQKTTGYIKFYQPNSYYHVCEHCKKEYKFDKSDCHKCEH